MFDNPGTRESNVTISIVAVGGVRSPVRILVRIGVILFEQVSRLFSSLSIVVGWPREIPVRSPQRDTEEVMSLRHNTGEVMDGNFLEIGGKRNELEDAIDRVLIDTRRVHLW